MYTQCVDGSGASASVLSEPPSSSEGEVVSPMALCQGAGCCSYPETPVAVGGGSGTMGSLAAGKGPGVYERSHWMCKEEMEANFLVGGLASLGASREEGGPDLVGDGEARKI